MRYRDEHRQLAAIMFTDIVGYTAIMAADESGALRALKRSRKLVQKQARRFGGRWLESIGDGNLVSFPSATNAVNCALALQRDLADDADLRLRVGLHVGDVIEASGHIYGDGVNVASRIHALADPGGIAVSEPVYDAVRNKSGISADPLGVKEIKGLDHPIQVYSLSGGSVNTPRLGFIELPGKRRWVVAAAVMLLAVVGVLSAGFYGRYVNDRADDTSIAVLPFEDLSEDGSNRYFSEGISEELINGLSRVPGLRVAGRSSSFAYADREQDLRSIGKQLNVSHVLDGSVRKAGNRVQISAQLANAETGFLLWTETYSAETDDIFLVQQSISQSIVEALRLELMPRELADVGRISTRDVQAYDLYLKARGAMREANSGEDFDEAIGLLDRALRRDPTFAEAEAAKCESLVEKYRATRNPDDMEPAVNICNRALAMDPDAPQAHIALGKLYLAHGRPAFAVESFGKAMPLDPDNAEIYLGLARALMEENRVVDAESYFQYAITLAPENAKAYQNYAWAKFKLGRHEQALELFRKATQLDPEESRYYSDLGAILFSLGRVDEATEAMIRATETDPYAMAYNNIGSVLFFGGEYERSVEIFRKAVRLMPEDTRPLSGLADACRHAQGCDDWPELYARTLELADERLRVNPEDAYVLSLKAIGTLFLERHDEARHLMEQAVALDPNDSQVMVNAAIVCSQTGDIECARKYVQRAVSLGYSASILDAHPDIQVARSDMNAQDSKGR